MTFTDTEYAAWHDWQEYQKSMEATYIEAARFYDADEGICPELYTGPEFRYDVSYIDEDDAAVDRIAAKHGMTGPQLNDLLTRIANCNWYITNDGTESMVGYNADGDWFYFDNMNEDGGWDGPYPSREAALLARIAWVADANMRRTDNVVHIH
jgi:hypothetical protein